MYKIAIVGKANSGKNTVSKFLCKKLKFTKVKTISFADAIKDIAKILVPNINDEFLYGDSEYRKEKIKDLKDQNDNNISVRKLLIDIGKFGRNYNEDIWVNILKCKILQYESENYDAIIVTDLRFPNELAMLKHLNYFIIKLNRENNTTKIDDESETAQDLIDISKFNFIINNNSSLEHLNLQIDDLIHKLSII